MTSCELRISQPQSRKSLSLNDDSTLQKPRWKLDEGQTPVAERHNASVHSEREGSASEALVVPARCVTELEELCHNRDATL